MASGEGKKAARQLGNKATRLQDGGVKAAEESGAVFGGQLVLPDPQDAPALFAESAIDQPVAGLVGRELTVSKGGVVHRHSVPMKQV